MADKESQDNTCHDLDGGVSEREKQVSALLSDLSLRDLLIQKLTEDGHVAKQNSSTQQNPPIQQNGGGTPGGNQFSAGGWTALPVHFPFLPFLTHPAWGSSYNSPVSVGSSHLHHGSAPGLGQPGSSRGQDQEEGEEEDEDRLDLLDEEEALELVQFEPAVDEKDTWNACDTINNFTKKAFNQVATPTARDGTRIEALSAPKLDNDVKKQIEMAGKDPHYGVEKHL